MFYWVLMGILFLARSVAAAETVGLLSLVSGDVKIVRAGEQAPVAARTADLLGAGDRVLTGRNSETVFLFCPESRTAKILADAEVQFDTGSLQVRKGKLADDHKVPSCRLPTNLALSAASRMQSGMMRLRGSNLVMRSPANTNVATLQPRFRWDPVENAKTYDLTVRDREERVFWRQSVPGTEAQYPPEAQALAWGQKYWWRVTARENEDILTEAGSFFQVLPQDQAERVKSSESGLRRMIEDNPSDNGPRFLLAFLYEDNGMLDEAARTYGQLIQQMGPQEWVQGRLTELMNKLGWDKLESGPPR